MFLLAWNNAFDTPYIVERIKALGYNPEDIMCDKDFDVKFVRYFIDERNKDEYAERGDFYDIAMDTVVLDQMIQFASRRKSRANINSYRLDDIGEMIAGVNKLDYSDITNRIEMLPYLDYKTFVFYNIMDVIVQICIESKCQDLEYIYNKCLINNTLYQKGHRQTIYLVNRFTKEFRSDGFIIGNNNNLNSDKDIIRGAMVGDPKNTNDYAKLKINGQPSSIVDNLVDYDYKSMHPNMTLENNMAPNTQIGCIEIPDQIYEFENRFRVERWHRQEEFAEAITTQNILLLCSRWFGLANYMELLEDVKEYFLMEYEYDMRYGYRPAMYKKFRGNECVSFNPNLIGNYMIRPVAFHRNMPDTSGYIDQLRRTVIL
jgi:DNA polymerase elongation subunit (family B)